MTRNFLEHTLSGFHSRLPQSESALPYDCLGIHLSMKTKEAPLWNALHFDLDVQSAFSFQICFYWDPHLHHITFLFQTIWPLRNAWHRDQVSLASRLQAARQGGHCHGITFWISLITALQNTKKNWSKLLLENSHQTGLGFLNQEETGPSLRAPFQPSSAPAHFSLLQEGGLQRKTVWALEGVVLGSDSHPCSKWRSHGRSHSSWWSSQSSPFSIDVYQNCISSLEPGQTELEKKNFRLQKYRENCHSRSPGGYPFRTGHLHTSTKREFLWGWHWLCWETVYLLAKHREGGWQWILWVADCPWPNPSASSKLISP